MEPIPIQQHSIEMDENRGAWERKPALRACYTAFYEAVKANLAAERFGPTLELGSGLGKIKGVIPWCITSDLFANPWLDRPEVSAYRLPWADGALGNIILFDVFHHLRHPGTALREFHRALAPGGRVVLFEPGFGLVGRLIYEWFHHEPCGFGQRIEWEAPEDFDPERDTYYAAQGNAWRFVKEFDSLPYREDWNLLKVLPVSAFAYLGSGGFRGPTLYPMAIYPFLTWVDRILSICPMVFAARLLVVLEKASAPELGCK